MQAYQQIQFQIGAWATANFGNNETPYLEILEAGSIVADKPRKPDDKPDKNARHNNMVVELGSLAPLMGLVEELGGFMAAFLTEDKKGIEDALGDIAVCVCDYCCHESILFPTKVTLTKKERYATPVGGAMVYLGTLYRCHLKRHQRIRNMHNKRTFEKERAAALHGFVWHLEAMAKEYTKTPLLTILNKTWNNIVKKRDRRADATAGGHHTHEEAK